MNKKNLQPTISIGIPAHNEEGNIAYVLRSVLSQQEQGWKLAEILVVADGCTDHTVDIVRSFKDTRIKLFINNSRQGLAFSQNKMAKLFKGDFLLLLNADIIIKDPHFISSLLAVFKTDKKIGLVCPSNVRVEAQSLFGRIIAYSVLFKRSVFSSYRNGNNLYTCVGTARLFSRELAGKIRWPFIVGEDSFSYLSCIKEGFRYTYAPHVQLFYKTPESFRDHQRQSVRFYQNRKELKKHIPEDLVDREKYLPKFLLIKAFCRFFIHNPLYMAGYIVIQILVKVIPTNKPTPIWTMATSTKTPAANIIL